MRCASKHKKKYNKSTKDKTIVTRVWKEHSLSDEVLTVVLQFLPQVQFHLVLFIDKISL